VAFNSLEFLVFFVVVFCAYWAIPFRQARTILLLVASYWFYMSFSQKLAAVVAASSLVDYFLARTLEASQGQRRRKALLTASIVMNLGLLFYFKYSNFFLASLGQFLHGIGLHAQMPVLRIILPIGISFYTFEAVSYMVDVYSGRVQAEKNPFNFLLFISFFPRMIAGPIIRARNFLPQLAREKRFDWGRMRIGFNYVLMGLFKKIVIADRMAFLVDPVFDTPQKYTSSAVWIAVVAYSLQIYGDFSGYSDIAIGTAHMLGFKLPENFNMPYIARNISEFWRRWHISLSTWLRDYVFISLGGSRGTLLRTCYTLMATFTLCGLWHGANWTFVAFGVVHGLMMVFHRFFQEFCKPRPALQSFLKSQSGIILCVALTDLAVTVGWIFFRSPNFTTVADVLYRLFSPQPGVMVRDPVGPFSLVSILVVVVASHVLALRGTWDRIAMRIPPAAWAFGCATLIVAMFLLRTDSHNPFIYFQF
jgi:alginate O-acetyltransferase complex protein AlgI